ncbi:MAG: DEAD/DEAH box helicase family protein, partial [Coxiellaceae bacterium]|nr:DEAD/DEAH box helicase family protein [Coxiellaceae bacterium]
MQAREKRLKSDLPQLIREFRTHIHHFIKDKRFGAAEYDKVVTLVAAIKKDPAFTPMMLLSSQKGYYPLHFLVMYKPKGDRVHAFTQLLNLTLEINPINVLTRGGNNTALIKAVERNNVIAVKLLRQANADIYAKNSQGMTAMRLARVMKQANKLDQHIMAWLQAPSINIMYEHQQDRLMWIVEDHGYTVADKLEQLEKLLVEGFSPNVIFANHLPIMHFACMLAKVKPENKPIYDLLLAYGGDRALKNSKGQTPEEYANVYLAANVAYKATKKREREEAENQQQLVLQATMKKHQHTTDTALQRITNDAMLLAARYVDEYLDLDDKHLQLKPHQIQAMHDFSEHLAKQRHVGYLDWPTGTGKTILAIAMMKALRRRVLIVAPTIVIMNQFADRINEFYPDISIGMYYGEQKSVGDITITTYQTLALLKDQGVHIANDIGLVIADEVHHALSAEYKKGIEQYIGNSIVVG